MGPTVCDEKVHLCLLGFFVVAEIFTYRPRKCLGYQTPQEVFDEARGGALATWSYHGRKDKNLPF
ncbi:MAG: hypothetical protein C0617_11725 [Desulfuromonas sp.]|nr:MAG: hypothetical protein C0617_11725 [Desulfuromonas sp.]